MSGPSGGPVEDILARVHARLQMLQTAADDLARVGTDGRERTEVAARRRQVLDRLVAGFGGPDDRNGRQPV